MATLLVHLFNRKRVKCRPLPITLHDLAMALGFALRMRGVLRLERVPRVPLWPAVPG